VVQSRSWEVGRVPSALLPWARLTAGGLAADRVRGPAWPSHARLQLTRHATQQCGCLAGVPAKEGPPTGTVHADERSAPAAELAAV